MVYWKKIEDVTDNLWASLASLLKAPPKKVTGKSVPKSSGERLPPPSYVQILKRPRTKVPRRPKTGRIPISIYPSSGTVTTTLPASVPQIKSTKVSIPLTDIHQIASTEVALTATPVSAAQIVIYTDAILTTVSASPAKPPTKKVGKQKKAKAFKRVQADSEQAVAEQENQHREADNLRQLASQYTTEFTLVNYPGIEAFPAMLSPIVKTFSLLYLKTAPWYMVGNFLVVDAIESLINREKELYKSFDITNLWDVLHDLDDVIINFLAKFNIYVILWEPIVGSLLGITRIVKAYPDLHTGYADIPREDIMGCVQLQHVIKQIETFHMGVITSSTPTARLSLVEAAQADVLPYSTLPKTEATITQIEESPIPMETEVAVSTAAEKSTTPDDAFVSEAMAASKIAVDITAADAPSLFSRKLRLSPPCHLYPLLLRKRFAAPDILRPYKRSKMLLPCWLRKQFLLLLKMISLKQSNCLNLPWQKGERKLMFLCTARLSQLKLSLLLPLLIRMSPSPLTTIFR